MAPLRRAAAAGSLVIDDYQKILIFFRQGRETAVFYLRRFAKYTILKQKNGARHFCVWTSPDTMGLVQARRAEREEVFRMKKRIFAALLALVLLLGVLPVTAMAADDVSKVVKSAFTTWDTYERALVLTNNIAEPVYATVVVKPGETITDFGNLVFFTTGGHALSSGFSNTLRWNYTPDVVDLNVVEDGGTLRVSFTGKQEGTAKVKLNYWTSYYFPDSQTGSGVTAHCSGDIYYNLIVSNDPVDLDKKPEKPGKDVLDTLVGDTTNVGVYLRCDDSDNYNNNNKHDQPFSTIAFTEDSCLVSDVFANDGTYDISDIRTYPWMCKVTVYGQPFVDYYNNVLKGKDKGNHYLLNPTSRYFYLYYNVTTGEWDWVADLPPIFGITKIEKNMQDITLAYDGGDHAADKVTGIPASETKRVNTGAKAKFTVSSDVPTCGCGKDCTFLGWKLDGDTKLYVGSDAIELDESATLHAQWREGSGDNDNKPVTPVGPGEGESDSGNVDFGYNQIIVKCVTPKSAEDPTPVHGLLSSPIEKSTIVPGSGKMDETAGTGSIDVYVTSYVEKYVKENGAHTKKLAADTVTIPLTWNATTQKWNVPVNTNTTVEVECVTVNPPLDPPPAGPTDNDVEGLLNGRTVRVRCATDNTLHTELGYAAKNGLTGGPAKLEGGYTRGEKTYTAYTITLDTDKFVTLYSGTAPTGTGVAHTRDTAQTGGTLTWYIYWDGSDWALDTKDEEIVYAVHSTEPETTSYTVHYYLENSTTKVANDRVVSDAKVGEEATETAPTLTGFTALAPTEQKLTPTAAGPNELIFYYTEDQEIDFKEQLTGKSVAIVCVTPKVDGTIYYTPDSKSLTKTAPLTRQVTVTSEALLALYNAEDFGTHTLKAGQPANVTWTATWNAGTRTWNVSVSKDRIEVEHAEKVTVRFDCQVTGMTNPPDQTVTKGEKATAPDMTDAKYERTGYTFEGWYETAACTGEKFNFTTAINADKTLYAKWTARTDIPYTVKYVDQDTNVVLKTENKTGTFNETVHESAIQISGYTAVAPTSKDLKLENVSGNELIFYYTKDPVKVSYTVHYYLDGTTTKVAADKVVNNVNAGTEVTEDAISVTGYTAAAPTQQKLNLSATGTNEIIFYYTKNVGTQVAYTIRYLKEGTGEALLPAYSGTGVAGNSLTVTAPAIDGYTALAPTSYTITLNADAAKNIITFYYREATSTIPAGEPAKEPFNKNANPRQLNRDDHFAYIKGYPDGTVRPEASLTRAEAAAILYRVMEKSCVERFHAENSSFRDVPDGKWYTTYVATLEKAGVIVDSKDGNFHPNDAITRAELASMLAQFANVTGGTNTFSDVPATHWAADYIAAAVRSGWIQGYPDGAFRPEQTIKRAEMTAMVNRALGRDPQSASDLLEGMKTWKDNADPTAWFYLDIQEAANGHTYARKTGGEYWTGLVADVVQ